MDRLCCPRSSVPPASRRGHRYEVAFNPEFLRESTAVKDYFAPPKIVVGEREPGVTRRLLGIYDGIDAPFFEVPMMVAEMAKFVDNSWHAEGGVRQRDRPDLRRPRAAAAGGGRDLPGRHQAQHLALLPAPGRALWRLLPAQGPLRHAGAGARVRARRAGAGRCQESNGLHLAWLAQAIRARLPAPGPILQLGLSFKAGTDDLRNSPLLDLAEILVEGGYDLTIHDPDVDPARLVGVNFAVAVEHQATLMDRMTQDLEGAAAEHA